MKRSVETITIGLLSLGISLSTSPVFGSTINRQDFSGEFTRTLSTAPRPQTADYEGFITYDENNSLLDWEINVEELDLFFDPDTTLLVELFPDVIELSPDVTLGLSSESNWELRIDFGIAFDAPLYTLSRNSEAINFSLTSFGEGFNYLDDSAEIVISSSKVAVPESSPTLAFLVLLSTMIILKRKFKI